MKRTTLGSVCLFSLVLCAGLHAMDKERISNNQGKTGENPANVMGNNDFAEMIEKYCIKGDFEFVKSAVDKAKVPVYKKSDEGKQMLHGLDTDLMGKYGKIFFANSMSNSVRFYDYAFHLAIVNSHYNIVECFLTNKYTNERVSEWAKTYAILVNGIEKKDFNLVELMLEHVEDTEVLKIVNEELKKLNK